jgi:DNA repair protein RecO (recombination protein O)
MDPVAPSHVYRTAAIVLRQMDYGEADRILTLLTPAGKVTAIAKGIRRPTSRKVGHLGLFCHVQLVMARGRNMDIVSQAETIEDHEGLSSDLLRYAYASSSAELMDRFAQEEEENSALFDLMSAALGWLANEQDPRLWARYYELHLLSNAGYQPQVQQCVACHAVIVPEANGFSLEGGGLVCPRCAASQAQIIELPLVVQRLLRYLTVCTPEQVRALRVTPGTHEQIESLLRRYLEYVMERELRSAVVLRRLRQDLRIQRAAPDAPAPPTS